MKRRLSMLRKIRLFIPVIILYLFYCSINVAAWDDDPTHQDLSEKAAEHSILSPLRGDYLQYLGFK
ncbi:MAG: hypothetical protein IT393_03610 [Nitrospirae bacterium]|nr:hypothetical protein [Nitrospirota bacterium]